MAEEIVALTSHGLLNKSKLVQVDLLELAEVEEMLSVLPIVDLDYLRANAW